MTAPSELLPTDRVDAGMTILVRVKPRSGKWCAVFGNFIDLQASPAGFGPRPMDAVAELRKAA